MHVFANIKIMHLKYTWIKTSQNVFKCAQLAVLSSLSLLFFWY